MGSRGIGGWEEAAGVEEARRRLEHLLAGDFAIYEVTADRALVRDTVSIVGLCELAEESAGGGDPDLLGTLLAEGGLAEASQAAEALQNTIAEPPRVASPAYLDAIGAAASRLERALGDAGPSPFAHAMQAGAGAVDELVSDVERTYKRPLV